MERISFNLLFNDFYSDSIKYKHYMEMKGFNTSVLSQAYSTINPNYKNFNNLIVTC